jgi:hypothetical protein
MSGHDRGNRRPAYVGIGNDDPRHQNESVPRQADELR